MTIIKNHKEVYICKKCGKNFTYDTLYINHKIKCKISKELINSICYDYEYGELSTRDLNKKYNIHREIITKYLKLNNIIRSIDVARTLVNSKGRIGHSDKTKEKIRISRIKLFRNNKQTEKEEYLNPLIKKMRVILIENGLDNYEITIEKCFGEKFSSFCYEEDKVIIDFCKDIDGIYKNKDYIKMSKSGYKLFPIPYSILREENINVLNKLLSQLKITLSKPIDSPNNGFIIEKPLSELIADRKAIERHLFNGLTKKSLERTIIQRQVERPSYEELMEKIKDHSYITVGAMYNVSGVTIFNWKSWYEKYDPNLNKKNLKKNK